MPKFVDYGDQEPPKPKSRFSRPVNGVFTCLVIALAWIYIAEPNWAYALTMWPSWVSLGLIAILNLFRRGKGRFNYPMTLATLSAALAIGLSDSPAQFLHWGHPTGKIRVTSLNCAAGMPEAMWEVAATKPDIVLLQERPSNTEIKNLAKSLFGDEAVIAYGPDAAVIARGKQVALGESTGFAASNRAWAVVDTKWGRIGICSLRLSPPLLRFELLRAESWRDCDIHKQQLTKELEELIFDLPPDWASGSMPIILGGDMNTPPDRVVQRPLVEKLGLKDSFWSAGRTWGGTAVNEYPLIRIDQIWSRGLVPVCTQAQTTKNSDHRMVVADFDLPGR